MKIVSLMLGAAALFLLPGCRPAADRADTGEAMAEGAGVGDRPTGRTGDPVSEDALDAPVPANIDQGVEPMPANGASPASLPTSIPEQFRGRWGLTPNDCKPGRSDAKGLLTIDGNRLTFYESRGTLGRVVSNSPPDRLTADYSFTGEGQSWERTITLTRSGNRLRRVEEGSEEGPVDLTYSACPA